jgi:hypothetical protein
MYLGNQIWHFLDLDLRIFSVPDNAAHYQDSTLLLLWLLLQSDFTSAPSSTSSSLASLLQPARRQLIIQLNSQLQV